MCHTLFENIDYPLVGLDLVNIDDVDGYVLETCINPGTLLNELLFENYILNKSHTPFENTKYPLVELDLVGVDDADGRALEHSDITRTLLNELLIKKYK